jgi:hypothetical protein
MSELCSCAYKQSNFREEKVEKMEEGISNEEDIRGRK